MSAYSQSSSATAKASLDNYFNTTTDQQASGVRAPIITIGTGGSTVTPNVSTSATSSVNSVWTYVAIGAALFLFLAHKKGTH